MQILDSFGLKLSKMAKLLMHEIHFKRFYFSEIKVSFEKSLSIHRFWKEIKSFPNLWTKRLLFVFRFVAW